MELIRRRLPIGRSAVTFQPDKLNVEPGIGTRPNTFAIKPPMVSTPSINSGSSSISNSDARSSTCTFACTFNLSSEIQTN